jgi:hypothetical protein
MSSIFRIAPLAHAAGTMAGKTILVIDDDTLRRLVVSASA